MGRNNISNPAAEEKTVTVTGGNLAYGGANAARMADGKVCFVRGLLPGECAAVRITAEKAAFARGILLEVTAPSPERIVPECAAFPECQGCAYLHCSYEAETAAKDAQLAGFLLRSGLTRPEKLLPPFPAPERFNRRNKLTPATGRDESGKLFAALHGEDNTSLTALPPEGCRLVHPELRHLLTGSLQEAGIEEKLLLRHTPADGAVRVTKDTPPLTETLLASDFLVAADGFFQTNPAVAEELARRCMETVKKFQPRQVLELYCGVGVFSILSAKAVSECRFTGVELDPAAIKFAGINAANNGVGDRCRFFAGDAAKALERNRRADLVIVDPPRSGLDRTLARKLAVFPAKALIYISCGPDTLARDLKTLTAGKWQITSAGILDMFPGTAHFETMIVLEEKCGK